MSVVSAGCLAVREACNEHVCVSCLWVLVASRGGATLISDANYTYERVEKVMRPSQTRSLSSRPSAPGLIERQTSNFRHASLRSVCVASCPVRTNSGALATGHAARRPTSRWRWRQGSVSGASPEKASLERASGVAGQEIQEPSLIRLRKLKLRMTRTWSNLL